MTTTKISFRRGQTVTSDVPKSPSPLPTTEQVSIIKTSPPVLKPTPSKPTETVRFALPGIVKRPATEDQKKIKDTGPTQPKIKNTGSTQPKILISKDKKTEVEEPKKRGRPSKEEIEKREKEKLEEENRIKDELIQKGTGAVKEVSVASFMIPDPSIPLFKVGEYVRDKVVVGKKIFKGMVSRQDLDSPRYVFVAWKDGSRQWHSAVSLERISHNDYKRKSTPDEIDVAELDALKESSLENSDSSSIEDKEINDAKSM